MAISRASIIEFARFLGVGGIAALANLCSRYVLNFVMPFEVAVVLAYMVGMVVGFLLFQKMLFGGGDRNAPCCALRLGQHLRRHTGLGSEFGHGAPAAARHGLVLAPIRDRAPVWRGSAGDHQLLPAQALYVRAGCGTRWLDAVRAIAAQRRTLHQPPQQQRRDEARAARNREPDRGRCE